MVNIPIPDARLKSAIPYLKKGGRVIDVGTDHAYLPIYLVREGIVQQALACDINRGPIESARSNIATAGLSDQIDTLQTDGLHGAESFAPDDVMIFGMGGELIVKILSEASWLKSEEIGLILQPMTRAHMLRQWLTENGFCIEGEALSMVDRHYQTIYARYNPSAVTLYSEEEYILGRWNIEQNSPLFEGFLRHEIGVYEAILHGKSKSDSADTRDEERILKFLKERLEKIS